MVFWNEKKSMVKPRVKTHGSNCKSRGVQEPEETQEGMMSRRVMMTVEEEEQQ